MNVVRRSSEARASARDWLLVIGILGVFVIASLPDRSAVGTASARRVLVFTSIGFLAWKLPRVVPILLGTFAADSMHEARAWEWTVSSGDTEVHVLAPVSALAALLALLVFLPPRHAARGLVAGHFRELLLIVGAILAFTAAWRLCLPQFAMAGRPWHGLSSVLLGSAVLLAAASLPRPAHWARLLYVAGLALTWTRFSVERWLSP